MKKCIGGVILYNETIKQNSSSKKTIPELISSSGAVPGIKVDTGAKILAGSSNEKITEGLDGLRERLREYYKLGARFFGGSTISVCDGSTLKPNWRKRKD
jgi:fructose-bisphosphate aldolase class I